MNKIQKTFHITKNQTSVQKKSIMMLSMRKEQRSRLNNKVNRIKRRKLFLKLKERKLFQLKFVLITKNRNLIFKIQQKTIKRIMMVEKRTKR